MSSFAETVRQYAEDLKFTLSRPKQAIHQLLTLACVVLTALMLWKLLIVATGSECPVVVVLSGSMEPAFQRGDLLLLTQPKRLTAGDVVVYSLDDREIPIVHRVLSVHEEKRRCFCSMVDDETFLLTKGDANNVDDRGLYVGDALWLNRKQVLGAAQAYVPYAGMATIWLNDYPWLKYASLGLMGLLVLLGKE